jgi:ABC-type glutathione transport system ATPase component/ribosomal protein L40E
MPEMKASQDEQYPCPECGALNPLAAQRCSNCETTLIHSTLSLTRAEIDERNATFRIAPDQGSPYTVQLIQPLLNIGSSSNQEIHLQASGIAAYHARIRQEGILYRLYNLSTPRGVLVNEAEVQASQLLHDGDKVRLQDAEGQGVNITYSNPIERALAPKGGGGTYSLERLPFIIGRDPAANLNLDSLAVSWRHAMVTEKGGHVLEDLGSANGTFVNDRPIKGQYRLRQGDNIRIDQTLLVYLGKSLKRLAALQKYQLDAVDLEMTYRTGLPRKSLTTMKLVSLSIQPQEFVAIIGGSGSGKSTLLRALNGVNRATSGKVLVNGDNLYLNYEIYQPVIGYVPQSDIVHDDLTVYQSLWFGARLRFPNEQEVPRRQRIARVLDDLELKDFENRLVRNLSGGQKKRVSIAQE